MQNQEILTFDVIRTAMNKFDQDIINGWDILLQISTAENILQYTLELPDFPHSTKIFEQGFSLTELISEYNPGEGVDIELSRSQLERSFTFPATPIPRPRLPKRKKTRRKGDEKNQKKFSFFKEKEINNETILC